MTIEELRKQAEQMDYVLAKKKRMKRKGNAISRQMVLNACLQSINIPEAVDRIMDLPSVNPQEPKTGHWIDGLIAKVLEEVDGGTDDTYIRYADICNRVEKSIREYCGAKMVEPQESEE